MTLPARSIRRRSVLLPMAACSALLLTGCGSGGSGGTTVKGVHLAKAGQLTTCTHLPYPPFQFEKGGKVVGFDVAMIDLVAEELGVKQVVVDKSFETIKTGADLNANTCDVAAAGMTITDERKQNLDFSAPYFDATQALLARKGLEVNSLKDVKAKKLKLGSQSSTTGEDFARKAGVDSRSFESSDAELNGLRTGQVDVIVQDFPVVQSWLKDSRTAAKFELVGNLDTGEQYGFAVKKGGNPQLKKKIDAAIAKARKDGTYRKLHEKWIGPLPEDAR
ncbi:ABC transporter substrate-binding protein [Streptomyces sp. bgisy100]|uniref:ABC transporter substrate-binding protein n=1 Tax=Streptomyces sp. bgisy100 TaxID=3413783 RepID=UPI003D750B6A